ncbi:unnamed protein product [Gongylonema pulchrum]|uniref:Iso_dh domain-containing protein n=1 Tax=Gongylonema pulchrum TaxID=637853 RepID=A0A183CY37_9BILA|nr:unnamed protein product [Gongylonema pulchrum]
MDVANHLAFAYLCNGLKTGMAEYTVTFMHLQNALYDCLRENNLLKQADGVAETAAGTIVIPDSKSA